MFCFYYSMYFTCISSLFWNFNLKHCFLKSRYEVEVFLVQLCLPLCNPMDCSPPGCSVHGILQPRLLEGVTMSFYEGSSWSKDQAWIKPGRFLTVWANREDHKVGIFGYFCWKFPLGLFFEICHLYILNLHGI